MLQRRRRGLDSLNGRYPVDPTKALSIQARRNVWRSLTRARGRGDSYSSTSSWKQTNQHPVLWRGRSCFFFLEICGLGRDAQRDVVLEFGIGCRLSGHMLNLPTWRDEAREFWSTIFGGKSPSGEEGCAHDIQCGVSIASSSLAWVVVM